MQSPRRCPCRPCRRMVHAAMRVPQYLSESGQCCVCRPWVSSATNFLTAQTLKLTRRLKLARRIIPLLALSTPKKSSSPKKSPRRSWTRRTSPGCKTRSKDTGLAPCWRKPICKMCTCGRRKAECEAQRDGGSGGPDQGWPQLDGTRRGLPSHHWNSAGPSVSGRYT